MKKITSITSMKMVKSERGIISIFTATLLILVLSLVVLGLAQLSRREQRASLDTQLSTQAFYAAESGINDAIAAIKDKMTSGSVPAKTQCGDDTNYSVALPATKAELNTDGTVRYSCLLIDPTPGEVKATLSTNPSVLALTPANPSSLSTINLVWDPDPDSGSLDKCPASVNGNDDFVKKEGWNCNFGVVRIDLVPVSTLSRAAFQTNTVTAFLVPKKNTSGGTVAYNDLTGSGNGKVVGASCDTVCRVAVSVPNGNYYMRATSVYLSGFELRASSNAAAGNYVNSQVVVDSTGQAQDVLRRIAVNINLIGDQPSLASAALMSGDSVCKRFSVYNGYFDASTAAFDGGDGNPLCTAIAGTPPAPPSICSEPHDIVLVLDESSSMNSKWEDNLTRQEELKRLVNTHISTTASADGNHIGVVMFSNKDQTKKLLDLSSDVSLIKSTVNDMPWKGGTYYTRGLTIARDMLTGSAARSSVPKIIIFVSDGRPDATIGDDPSDETEPSILALTRNLKTNNGIAIYAIGIQQDGDPDAQSLLTSMSSGGSKYYANAKYVSDFSNFLADIQDDVSCPTP